MAECMYLRVGSFDQYRIVTSLNKQSYIQTQIDEAAKSFWSNAMISSTASSGYTLKDEIDPSNYSFTTALRALQARSGYVWECSSPDGFALKLKWNDAERYICNPLSGEVPI